MQIARMPAASWDSQKGRFVINWRFPKPLHAVTGPWFRDRFPKSMTPAQAAVRAAEKTVEFNAIIEAARTRLADPADRAGILADNIALAITDQRGRLARIRDEAAGVFGPIARAETVIEATQDEADLIRLATRRGYRLDFPADAGEPITTESVIELWIAERKADPNKAPPKDKAIDAYRAAAERMFSHLGLPDDFAKLTKPAVFRYREDLICGKVASTDKRGRLPHPRRNLEAVSALCGVAVRAAMARGITLENPAKGLPLPAKSDNVGQAFTLPERTAILVAARHADPVVRWAHWLMAFTAAILSELRYLTPANVYEKDGYMVVDIKPPPGLRLKTEWRPRIVPLHSAIKAEGFLDYVEQVRREHGADAPLFPMTEAKFERAVNGLIAGLEVNGKAITLRSYGHRHFVATELEGFIVEDDKGRKLNVSKYVSGHAPGDVHAKHNVHIPVARLVKPIESLPAA